MCHLWWEPLVRSPKLYFFVAPAVSMPSTRAPSPPPLSDDDEPSMYAAVFSHKYYPLV